jgi:hypothetical protein
VQPRPSIVNNRYVAGGLHDEESGKGDTVRDDAVGCGLSPFAVMLFVFHGRASRDFFGENAFLLLTSRATSFTFAARRCRKVAKRKKESR